ncbi:Hypothetical_protein [Hexamita inflata]|uniref:Hypothetical_protein n=1 Tax=Hexamita inflata TaxID=28002 RepID=A0AA86RN76_9EUKA|nr:Hypothetical protein HINF_LOCUS62739 [Hexamita inflata]
MKYILNPSEPAVDYDYIIVTNEQILERVIQQSTSQIIVTSFELLFLYKALYKVLPTYPIVALKPNESCATITFKNGHFFVGATQITQDPYIQRSYLQQVSNSFQSPQTISVRSFSDYKTIISTAVRIRFDLDNKTNFASSTEPLFVSDVDQTKLRLNVDQTVYRQFFTFLDVDIQRELQFCNSITFEDKAQLRIDLIIGANSNYEFTGTWKGEENEDIINQMKQIIEGKTTKDERRPDQFRSGFVVDVEPEFNGLIEIRDIEMNDPAKGLWD